MTGQRVPGKSIKVDRAVTRPPASAGVESILSNCDGLLGEVGRRRHLFSWLRDPSAAEPAWLPVDAYYPRRRLVIVCDPSTAHASTYRERVPAHGLALVEIATASLGTDATASQAALERKLSEATPTPAPAADGAARPLRLRARREPGAPPEQSALREARPPRDRQPFATLSTLMQPATAPPPAPRRLSGSQAAAAQRAARLLRARRALSPLATAQRPPAPRTRPWATPRVTMSRGRSPVPSGRATAQASAPGFDSVLIGLVLTVILCVEAYLGVVRVALGAGDLVLGLAIVIDGCARAFAAIAAVKLEQESWAWACVLGGSPVVAGFTLFQRSGPVDAEPAPLAGLLSLVALGLAALVLLAQLLGV